MLHVVHYRRIRGRTFSASARRTRRAPAYFQGLSQLCKTLLSPKTGLLQVVSRTERPERAVAHGVGHHSRRAPVKRVRGIRIYIEPILTLWNSVSVASRVPSHSRGLVESGQLERSVAVNLGPSFTGSMIRGTSAGESLWTGGSMLVSVARVGSQEATPLQPFVRSPPSST